MNAYTALGRIISLLLTPFFWVQNRVLGYLRPRVVVLNEKNQVLLIKNWVGRQVWELPGGAVKYGEEAKAAARRELYEEIGLEVEESGFHHVTTLLGAHEAPIYSVRVSDPTLRVRRGEIIACEWFDLDSLPSRISPRASLALAKIAKQ